MVSIIAFGWLSKIASHASYHLSTFCLLQSYGVRYKFVYTAQNPAGSNIFYNNTMTLEYDHFEDPCLSLLKMFTIIIIFLWFT